MLKSESSNPQHWVINHNLPPFSLKSDGFFQQQFVTMTSHQPNNIQGQRHQLLVENTMTQPHNLSHTRTHTHTQPLSRIRKTLNIQLFACWTKASEQRQWDETVTHHANVVLNILSFFKKGLISGYFGLILWSVHTRVGHFYAMLLRENDNIRYSHSPILRISVLLHFSQWPVIRRLLKEKRKTPNGLVIVDYHVEETGFISAFELLTKSQTATTTHANGN